MGEIKKTNFGDFDMDMVLFSSRKRPHGPQKLEISILISPTVKGNGFGGAQEGDQQHRFGVEQHFLFN